ncbi:carbon-phosphorus lyase complex subunit PhnI [Xanthobacter sp. 91]|uniref:carbon-phosphorus lyase complex subunit PhnI n=1 Tax=Xanthobacter sp. 91 TaxID=1117244 RepID=UPI0004955E11|nr:carbon-phosphorus lyase complex subunit PhnI [Xanthobacter sp. 91]
MYVAVKGGEAAIRNAHALLAKKRRGEESVPEIGLDQIAGQLSLAVDRVMAEGSLYDRELAALAIKQARGDLIEAIFLARAFRTTLPRFGASVPVDTGAMRIERRISATFKDLPGGQVLGPTFDYTHRLMDERLATQASDADAPRQPAPSSLEVGFCRLRPPRTELGSSRVQAGEGWGEGEELREAEATPAAPMPRVTDLLGGEGLIEPSPADDGTPPRDLTREPLSFPADRPLRLQALARGDEGFLLALGYSTQRGYARTHPFVGEIRFGTVEVSLPVEELGFAVPLGDIAVTECQSVNQFKGSATEPPQFTRGYGLVFGQSERKAMSMALVDRALRFKELGEEKSAPSQDEEFVLSHCDNVQATGFVEHLKLPHYVDFQAELDLIRRMRAEAEAPDEMKEAAE